MVTRIAAVFLFVAAVVAGFVPPSAGAQSQSGQVEVIVVDGPIDGFGVDFILGSLDAAEERDAMAVILKIDSPGVVSDRFPEVIEAIDMAGVPVVGWVGDAPAVAHGGAMAMLAVSDWRVAAPGAEIGWGRPFVAGSDVAVERALGLGQLDDVVVEVTEPIPDLVDDVQAALGPLIVSLDGRTFSTAIGPVTLRTVEQTELEDGSIRASVAPDVRFAEPGVFARTMRLALRPEAIFFFLTAGLAFAAFEFYAIGPGLAAATATIPLLLAGYGLAVLPVGWGLALVLLAMWVLTADFQRGGFGVLSYAAMVALFIGGVFMVDTRPQFGPAVWALALTAVGIALFYMFAMTTVARARFTTATIGRDHLIGLTGRALSDSASGALTIEVSGARWQAVTHREAGIAAGDDVVVQGVQGVFLDVDKPA